ncbi:hypothetical protein ACFPPD_13530 [Cohnella suwonensis]|uniref:Uncharacterized protein n=1 Tax=Cohnella suwonensis TaxID=696072 RepID=A0ABW0LVD7_9BACL
MDETKEILLSIKHAVEVLDAKVTGLDTRVAEIQKDVEVLKADVAVMKSDVVGLKAGQARLESVMGSVAVHMLDHETRIRELQGARQ